MNYRAIAHYLGLVLRVEAAFMLPSLALSFFLGESRVVWGFVAAISIALALSTLLYALKRNNKKIYIKESYFVVGVCWLVISLVGAVPLFFSGEGGSFINCLFETISGFTTTGATILENTDTVSRGLLLWRSFTMWLGGVGVVIFLVAVIQATPGGRSFHVMQAESTGPSPVKIVPRLRDSLIIIYCVYVGLTVLEAVLLLLGGMPLFDSVNIAMVTAGTGGFAVRSGSMAAYGSLYLEMVVGAFMILCGINFSLYFYLIARNFHAIGKNGELRAYLGIIAVGVLLVTLNLTSTVYGTPGQSLRHSFFQVGSMITTTGMTTADITQWPTFSKTVLLLLMFIGGCAGSSAGGLKVARVMLMLKVARRSLFGIVRPRSVTIVTLNGKEVDRETVHHTIVYIILFMLLYGASMLLISLDNVDMETTFFAVCATMNNVGCGFGMVAPMNSFHDFSTLSKLVLSLDMLLGRLELYPILLLFAPSTWRRG